MIIPPGLKEPLSASGSWARRRQKKIVWRLRQSDAIVVTHTKSGRTWLLVMISHLFHLKYGTPAREIVKFDNLHRLDARAPKIYFTRWANLLDAWGEGWSRA